MVVIGEPRLNLGESSRVVVIEEKQSSDESLVYWQLDMYAILYLNWMHSTYAPSCFRTMQGG